MSLLEERIKRSIGKPASSTTAQVAKSAVVDKAGDVKQSRLQSPKYDLMNLFLWLCQYYRYLLCMCSEGKRLSAVCVCVCVCLFVYVSLFFCMSMYVSMSMCLFLYQIFF